MFWTEKNGVPNPAKWAVELSSIPTCGTVVTHRPCPKSHQFLNLLQVQYFSYFILKHFQNDIV